jgi:DNA repair protein RecN (Recombination protein N)
MLKLLKIKNIAIVTSVELELGPGLTLLTGETGAGKSILIDALGLLFGARASGEMIRSGEEQAVVEALAESAEARAFLEGRAIPCDGEEIVVRREISTSGKARATVNGALVPVALLRELGEFLGAIHGQHEPQGLLDPRMHLDLLDHHAGLSALVTALDEPYQKMRIAEAALERLRDHRREHERRREMLEYQAQEIEKAGLTLGEDEALRREKVLQANASRLAALCGEAYLLLYEDEAAVLGRLGQVYRRVEELAGLDPRLAPFLEARAAIQAQIEDLALFLRDYREAITVSPGRLDEIEARLALIERLKKKYGASVEDVIRYGASCRSETSALGSPEEHERMLETERAESTERYLAAARELSRKRRRAARELEQRVRAELDLLAMEKTRFEVRFDPAPGTASAGPERWTEKGLETAEFLLSPNPGEELKPLARIASGGELSRILLALKSVASLDAQGKTLVFDEVDAGIGGRVAEVVGRKLREISERHQVLCVTHLPQIASMADCHYVVRKHVERGRTVTEVQALSADERIEEVARMLGGATVTEMARRHAREMVKQSIRS